MPQSNQILHLNKMELEDWIDRIKKSLALINKLKKTWWEVQYHLDIVELPRGHMQKFTEINGLIKNFIIILKIYPNKHMPNYNKLDTINIYYQSKTFGSHCMVHSKVPNRMIKKLKLSIDQCF